MFGGLNALFSGFAFLGIIVTILMQRKELELQRRELGLTRKTLESQRKEMEAQNKTLKIQQFENTFFSLLRVHNDIVNSIDLIKKDGQITKGRDCFRTFLSRLKEDLSRNNTDRKSVESAMVEDGGKGWINIVYSGWWRSYRTEVGHYYRTLYNIIKFVDESDIGEKTIYTNIVRASMSDQEQALLFYYCLSDIGNSFKDYTIKYALIKHVSDDLLENPNHKEFYDSSIFS